MGFSFWDPQALQHLLILTIPAVLEGVVCQDLLGIIRLDVTDLVIKNLIKIRRSITRPAGSLMEEVDLKYLGIFLFR